MNFIVIVGPMKSGKSLELIARLAPYQYADKRVLLVKPDLDVRDEGVSSRIGLQLDATIVKSLRDVSEEFDVVGIDEAHMFDSTENIEVIKYWLASGKEVYLSGLDVDYQGQMTTAFQNYFALKPSNIIDKIAVCESCKSYNARFTQILKEGKPITTGLPSIVPEDGTYEYHTRCRKCFVTN